MAKKLRMGARVRQRSRERVSSFLTPVKGFDDLIADEEDSADKVFSYLRESSSSAVKTLHVNLFDRNQIAWGGLESNNSCGSIAMLL